ncbi:hypothetical protein T492DRAFT_70542 [Pavlovales sp. CCMP2436]|nr:hypothetical protein T492DRAFT_70542 [Pavlovales sp. CCMP2436]
MCRRRLGCRTVSSSRTRPRRPSSIQVTSHIATLWGGVGGGGFRWDARQHNRVRVCTTHPMLPFPSPRMVDPSPVTYCLAKMAKCSAPYNCTFWAAEDAEDTASSKWHTTRSPSRISADRAAWLRPCTVGKSHAPRRAPPRARLCQGSTPLALPTQLRRPMSSDEKDQHRV